MKLSIQGFLFEEPWIGNFFVELNDFQLWGADVGNAFLQALTKEKLYIVAGPECE